VIKEVPSPHDCQPELREVSKMDLWIGSIVECSCGDRYVCNDDQREGLHWVRVPKPAGGWPAIDQSSWPAHLRDDAPSQRCSRCGRNTWAVEEFGNECRMPQPSGKACGGRFGA
jgi:hypothetical protein